MLAEGLLDLELSDQVPNTYKFLAASIFTILLVCLGHQRGLKFGWAKP